MYQLHFFGVWNYFKELVFYDNFERKLLVSGSVLYFLSHKMLSPSFIDRVAWQTWQKMCTLRTRGQPPGYLRAVALQLDPVHTTGSAFRSPQSAAPSHCVSTGGGCVLCVYRLALTQGIIHGPAIIYCFGERKGKLMERRHC